MERFDRNLAGLAETFEKELSSFAVMVYEKAMLPFTDDQIEAAMMSAALTMKFFPKPAELIEILIGSSQDRSIAAWDSLQHAVQYAGAYGSVRFEDGKIVRVIKLLGGWQSVCAWEGQDITFRRQEFMKLYQGMTGELPSETVAGIHEINNASRGFPGHIPEPLVVGNGNRPKLQQLEGAV